MQRILIPPPGLSTSSSGWKTWTAAVIEMDPQILTQSCGLSETLLYEVSEVRRQRAYIVADSSGPALL